MHCACKLIMDSHVRCHVLTDEASSTFADRGSSSRRIIIFLYCISMAILALYKFCAVAYVHGFLACVNWGAVSLPDHFAKRYLLQTQQKWGMITKKKSYSRSLFARVVIFSSREYEQCHVGFVVGISTASLGLVVNVAGVVLYQWVVDSVGGSSMDVTVYISVDICTVYCGLECNKEVSEGSAYLWGLWESIL